MDWLMTLRDSHGSQVRVLPLISVIKIVGLNSSTNSVSAFNDFIVDQVYCQVINGFKHIQLW